MKKPKNYLDNKKFYESLKAYQQKVKAFKAGELTKEPMISDYIGQCFMDIAKNLATKGCFSGYTYIDEMKEDGIENCIMAIHSFDSERFNNPHAYFTKVIWWAFLRRIEREKKESYVKHMSLVNASIHDLVLGGGDMLHNTIDDEKAAALVAKFEKKKPIKKKEVDK